ncbi:MAG TPA: bifunctional transaldolase/phosoglucose isomerase [Pyrinomonadaceae bacterium]|nr:bifunctional transaldolase/phosoglucose isomerase [Pyrinomonadaceae bacterium]
MTASINRQTLSLPPEFSKHVSSALDAWSAGNNVERLWANDASLWTGKDEDKWLGWLTLVDEQRKTPRRFANFAAEVRDAGFAHALVLGMGGSSLCPEVLKKSFGRIEGFPELHVLDSTDPAQVKSFADRIDLTNSLFFVSSKSGTTLEPNIFKQYFFERVREAVGDAEAGKRFIAITDPRSKLRQAAELDHFRKIFLGVPSVGGRYSAFSDFGLAPACAMGIDVERFLESAAAMADACRRPPMDNPGVILGALLGVAHNQGRDKLTVIASPGINDFGAWLEQLVAESTGKNGKGIIPVDRESLGPEDIYGDDRLFVYLRLESAPDSSQDDGIEEVSSAGHPVIRISIPGVYDLGQEFFRWEIATAVAGSIIGINPFNQPDVEASKIETRKLTEQYEETGSLPEETPLFEGNGIKLFAGEKNAAALESSAGDASISGYLKAHLDRIQLNDYFALLAYLEMNDAHEHQLQSSRHAVRDAKRVATCLGFGPRFLHSTGQAYKGGSDSGVFLQITCDDAADLPVPGQRYTFGVVKAAQARGDFAVLAERGRRALRVHLGADVDEGLARLHAAIREAIG